MTKHRIANEMGRQTFFAGSNNSLLVTKRIKES